MITSSSLGRIGDDSSGPVAVTHPGASLTAPARCPHARKGVAFYRSRYVEHRAVRGLDTPWPAGRKPRNCADAHYLAGDVWPARSYQARIATERWLEKLLRADTWLEAVNVVQRVFPGTSAWLLSCSDAESNHYRWVGYGGVPYSTWLRDSNTVGGYLQFRFGTFTGMWRRGAEHALARGFRLPPELLGDDLAAKTRAWQSALGQAIAGGWARYTGNDNSHWSASWGNGC